jgi:hypothetical protein
MAVGALFAIQVRLRLPRTDTRAVAPVACFAVLRLFRAATAESRTALIRRTPTAMIDSTRMRNGGERRPPDRRHADRATHTAQLARDIRGTYVRRISREDRAKSEIRDLDSERLLIEGLLVRVQSGALKVPDSGP